MAGTVLVHAVNEVMLKLTKEGSHTPNVILLWVKGAQKASFVKDMVASETLPVRVQNLEDAGCPLARQIKKEDPGPLMTYEKAPLFAEWLLQEGLDSDLLARRHK